MLGKDHHNYHDHSERPSNVSNNVQGSEIPCAPPRLHSREMQSRGGARISDMYRRIIQTDVCSHTLVTVTHRLNAIMYSFVFLFLFGRNG